MALLAKQDLVLTKAIKAIDVDQKQDILQMGNYCGTS